jgi:hypothetical protein
MHNNRRFSGSEMQHVETPCIVNAAMAIQCRWKKGKKKKYQCAIELGYLDEPHHVGKISSNDETPQLEMAG